MKERELKPIKIKTSIYIYERKRRYKKGRIIENEPDGYNINIEDCSGTTLMWVKNRKEIIKLIKKELKI